MFLNFFRLLSDLLDLTTKETQELKAFIVSYLVKLSATTAIESIVEDNKEGSYRALRETQYTLKVDVNYEPWLMFFLRTMQKHKVRLENKIGIDTIYMTELPELSAQIMEIFQSQKRITLSEVVEKTGANKNTINKHLFKLVSEGYIIKHGQTRGVWYTKKEES